MLNSCATFGTTPLAGPRNAMRWSGRTTRQSSGSRPYASSHTSGGRTRRRTGARLRRVGCRHVPARWARGRRRGRASSSRRAARRGVDGRPAGWTAGSLGRVRPTRRPRCRRRPRATRRRCAPVGGPAGRSGSPGWRSPLPRRRGRQRRPGSRASPRWTPPHRRFALSGSAPRPARSCARCRRSAPRREHPGRPSQPARAAAQCSTLSVSTGWVSGSHGSMYTHSRSRPWETKVPPQAGSTVPGDEAAAHDPQPCVPFDSDVVDIG